MRMPSFRWRQGFTLIEFGVTVLVAAAVSAFLLSRFDYYREETEVAATRQLVGALRTALYARAVQLQAHGQSQALRALAEDNPMNWLESKPANYLGEYYSPDTTQLKRGAWVFDTRDKSIVYLFSNVKSSSYSGARLLKFKVEFFHAPEQKSFGLVLNQIKG